jgi:hypothetical protein
MKNLILAVLILCGAGAVMLLAADSWQKKAYTTWDAKDIQRILNDSPWAREVEIMMGAPGMAGGRGGSGDLARSSSPLAGVGSPESGGGGMGGRGGGNAGMEGAAGPGAGSGGAPTVRLVVRFVSALPVRQAMMRARYGNEVGNSPEAAKVLSTPDPYYVVALAGLRRPPGDVQAVKEKSTLRVKGKEPFGPVQVLVENAMVVLFFPREGHPVAVQDGEVEVQVRLPGLANPIRRAFKLKDMVYDGKLEL